MEGGRKTRESETIPSYIKMKSDWEQSREALWEANLLGCKNPESLLRTMFLFNSLYFGLHSRKDHWKLCWGNVHLGITKEGFSFLQYVKNVQDKVSSSASSMQEDVSPIVISARPDRPERCPVRIYMMYAERRPINHCGPLTPFYLKPATCLEYGFQRWYTQQRAGLTRFCKFIQEIKHPLLAQKSWTTLLRVIQGMQIGHEEVHHKAKKEVNESLTTPSMSGSACSNPNMSLDLQMILVKDDDNPQEETPRKPSQDSTLNSSQTLILHTETLQPQPDQRVQLQRSPTFTPPFIIATPQAKRFSLTRAIALWFASDAQPPCSVEHPAFCAMLAALNCPSFLIPTCAELSSTTFPLLFKEVCTTVKNCISSLVSSELPVAYSSHVCQGHHNRWLIASVHYVDADWKQQSFCISVRPVVDKQACQLNKDDLDQWSLDKKYPIALVSDLIAGHCVPTSSSYHDLVLPCFSRIIARAVWVGLSEPAMRLLLERARHVGLEVGIRWDERTGDAEERPGYWLEVLHCLRILLEHQSPGCMAESSKTLNCKDTELLKSVLSCLWPLLEASESLMVEHYLPASSIGPNCASPVIEPTFHTA
uniref:ZMYM2-like/QRICH1 C-terminal domain-containing protein n=1 Tax=Eptatretus burgeri TaxID=7764 RepID=A0A8C4Q9A7_EPTBU